MRQLRAWLLRLAGMFARPRKDQELDAELEAHLQLHVEDFVRQGIGLGEARRRALIKLGGVDQTRERYRDRRGIPLMENLWRDLRYAVRILRASPGFSAVAILTLALGIGASTAIFTIANAVLFRPLPYREPNRLVLVFEGPPSCPECPASGPDYLDWSQHSQSFAALVPGTGDAASLTGPDREPVHLRGADVGAGIFDLLGESPFLGRTFDTGDQEPGKHIVMLSGQLWRNQFDGDRSIVGKSITLDGEEFEVAGVMPEGFRFPKIWGNPDPEFWRPLPVDHLPVNRGDHWLWVMGKLKSGVSLGQAEAQMATLSASMADQYPETNLNERARVEELREHLVGKSRPALTALTGAVGFLLLISCANVANLLLARASKRSGEIAVRLAIGAGRPRLVGQLLTESVLLALLGGSTGVLMGLWLKNVFVALSPRGLIPNTSSISLDAWALGFALLISLAAGILFGLTPAFRTSRVDPSRCLAGARGASLDPRAGRLLNWLVVLEVSCALLLLIGGGLLIRSLRTLQQVNVGFNARNLSTLELTLPESAYATGKQRVAFFESAVASVRTLPGITAAAATNKLALIGGVNNGYAYAEGQPADMRFKSPTVEFTCITPGYFSTMEMPLLRGRDFEPEDGPEAPAVAVISDTMARKFWPDQDPVGKRFSIDYPPLWINIVGLVGDVRQWGLERRPPAEAYFPYSQRSSYTDLYLVARSSTDTAGVARPIQEQILGLDRSLPVHRLNTMSRLRETLMDQPRFEAALMTAFSLIAFILAAVGVFGMISYTVSGQRYEIGIRMALGADPRGVMRLVLLRAARLILLGVFVGTVGALWLTRMLSGMLFGVTPTDPLTFASAAIVLALAGMAACYIPARRAMLADPVAALRY